MQIAPPGNSVETSCAMLPLGSNRNTGEIKAQPSQLS